MLTQPLPHDIEIEKALLGCLIIDERLQNNILKLSDKHFYDKRNQIVYNVLKYLVDKNKTIDLLTVSELANKRIENSLELIASMTDYCRVESYKGYFDKLDEYRVRRCIINGANEAIEAAYGKAFENTTELRNEALSKLEIDIDQNNTDYGMCSITLNVMDNIQQRFDRVEDERLYTGFADLDKLTAGLHKKEMTIIAAPPATGKTTFLVQLLINLSKHKNNCVMFSREMSKEQLGERVLANLASIDGQKIRFAKTLKLQDFAALRNASSKMINLPITINDDAISVEDMHLFCRELKNRGKLDVIAIDYVGLVKTLQKTQSREREIAEISWRAKMMAMDLDVPVVLLSQLNRDGRKSAGEGNRVCREPVMSDLKDSSSLEQDASNILFLWMPQKDDEAEKDDGNVEDVKLIIAKQRNGPSGFVWLKWYKNTFKFHGGNNR